MHKATHFTVLNPRFGKNHLDLEDVNHAKPDQNGSES